MWKQDLRGDYKIQLVWYLFVRDSIIVIEREVFFFGQEKISDQVMIALLLSLLKIKTIIFAVVY